MIQKKLYVFPNTMSGDKWSIKGNQHIKRLLQDISKENFFKVVHIDANKLLSLKNIDDRNSLKILFFNWPDTLYLKLIPKYLAIIISLLPKKIRNYYINNTLLAIIFFITLNSC
jgi:hypothetical protein